MKFDFKMRASVLLCATVFGASALMVACGGGGGGTTSAAVSQTDATIAGTVAAGAPFPAGTLIEVTDATGTVVASTNITSSDGSYSLTIPKTATAPFVIVASSDGMESMVSVLATLAASTTNITPITNFLASLLSPSGNPAQLATELKAGSATLSAEAIAAKKAVITTLLASVTGALGDSIDPLNGVFSANGSGHDRVLDSLNIAITPSTASTSNIEITVRQASADSAPPVSVTFAGGTAAPATPPSIPAVSVANLVAPGTAPAIAELLAKMQECYALAPASRVNTPVTNNSGNGTGPSDIKAGACKDMFYNADPATYLGNSYTVGNGAGSKAYAFKSLWRHTKFGATDGVKYDLPIYQFTRSNADKDIVFTARWVDFYGNSAVDTYVARKQADGKLRLIGNQSNYDLEVSPRVEMRDMLHANMESKSYLNIGYNVWAADDATIGKIVVTTPGNKTVTLKRITSGSYSYMGLEKSSGTVTTTSVIRMAAAYTNTATTTTPYNHPADIDGSLFWTWDSAANNGSGAPKNWTDAEIAAIPNQGTWKFEIYTVAAPTVIAATEYRRTTSRAPTMAEAKLVVWPKLTTAARADMKANTTNGGFGFTTNSVGNASGPGNTNLWEVPTGAWAPTSLKFYGRDWANNATFDDEATFGTATRKTTVYCSDQDGTGTADIHCVGSLFKGGTLGTVNALTGGVGIGQIQFNGRDQRRTLNTLSINFRNI